ncbi:MAG TPA: carboxypeptidase regulatory-like domain-containing protein [Candidatus Acidoferrum sp.]|nr:carboxypeptidase regulatory-like domain-containing protein [Candidatus Acidoferrum sp.]
MKVEVGGHQHLLVRSSAIVLCWLVLVCFPAVISTSAQSTGGRIRGTVTDPSGGSVTGAKLQITNEANGLQRDTESAASGEYIFLEVPVGTYQIEVSQQGFKKYLRKGLVVNLNEVVNLDIPLQLGGSTETVEVTGAPPLVDTTSTQLGAVVNERAISQLPLSQRDTYQLLQLQPGVQSQVGLDTVYGSDRAGVVSVNGGRGRDNNFTVNGGDGNDQFAGLPAIQPSPDAIAEFRVLTNTFDAEYGRNSGAVVNVVTKSGTNDFHGSTYEFFRNDALNARGFFDTSKLSYLQNQFGATLGGPIKKDKTFFFASYEGDRIRRGTSGDTVTVPTAAERLGDFSADPGFAGTLANANILNNRPGCLTALGRGSNIPDGTPYANIFTSNQIPTACMDQTALDLMNQFVPQANIGDSLFQGVPLGHERSNQFTLKVDHQLTNNQRLTGYYYLTDHYLAKPFARFQSGGANLPGFGDLTDERIQQINISHTWTIGPTAVNEARFTMFREGQGTFLHPQHTALVQDSCKTVPAANCFADPANPDLGIHPGLGATREGVPFVNISGGFNIGNNFEGELPQVGNTFQWSDNFSKTIGKHDLKFGGDARYQKFDQTLYFDVSGQYFYFGGGPNDPCLGTIDPTSGVCSAVNLFPNYLLGLPDEYGQGSAQEERVRTKSLYLFAQDSYKLRPNVTLNYGLRWELNTPLADAGQKVQTFRPGQATSIYPCQLSATTQASLGYPDANCNPGGSAQAVFPLGLVVPGDKGIPNGLSNTYYKSFAPRIGVAWSPDAKDGFLGKLFGGAGKTSIRAGYGIFYNPVEQLVLEQFSAEPPFGGSTFVFNTQFNTPFLGQDGQTTFPNPFNGILNPPRGQSVDWSVFRPILLFGQAAQNPRTQYAEQYNLTIQREVTRDMVLTMAYVGRQGHRLLASQDLNPGNPQTCLDLQAVSAAINDPSVACGPFLADSPYTFTLPAGQTFHLPYAPPKTPGGPNIPCPIANAPAACTITGAAGGTPITLVGTRPYSSPFCDPLSGNGCPSDGIPVISDIFTQNTISNSAYNGFQASLEKRFSHGLQFEAAYTLGKSIDNASTFESLVDPVNPKRDRSLSLFDARNRFVFSYYWEFPVPHYEGFKGKALDGWAMSGITTFQSGFPIRITEQDDIELQSSFDFETPGQPNIAAPFQKLDPRGPGNLGFNPSAFTEDTVAPGTIGNAPRTVCCGPGINNWEMAFLKITPLNERFKLEFRGELFNAFNHAQFFQPDGNFTDGTDFGRVKRARDPRLMQFALKLSF